MPHRAVCLVPATRVQMEAISCVDEADFAHVFAFLAWLIGEPRAFGDLSPERHCVGQLLARPPHIAVGLTTATLDHRGGDALVSPLLLGRDLPNHAAAARTADLVAHFGDGATNAALDDHRRSNHA